MSLGKLSVDRALSAKDRAKTAMLKDVLLGRAFENQKKQINAWLDEHKEQGGPCLAALQSNYFEQNTIEETSGKKNDTFSSSCTKIALLPLEYIYETIRACTDGKIDKIVMLRVKEALRIKGAEGVRLAFCLLFNLRLDDPVPSKFKSVATLVFMQRYKEMGSRGHVVGIFLVDAAGKPDYTGTHGTHSAIN
jgi:hypothetical protein